MSDEERWITVDGRRWRATDPAIPETLRQELVDELMSARRAVGAAGRSADADAEQRARARVQAAKVALGERGRAWWEEPTDQSSRHRAEATIAALLQHRAPDRSICPSDVARVIGGERWRGTMELVRDVAATMADRGVVEIAQRGERVEGRDWHGPVRIRLPR